MAKKIVNEHAIAKYTAVIKDEADVAIAAASLSTLTLTLYDLKGATIINSRAAQNVLNANNVTVDSSGNLVWTLQPADNPIIASGELESHIALFEYTWSSGTKRGSHEVTISVRDITKVAAL